RDPAEGADACSSPEGHLQKCPARQIEPHGVLLRFLRPHPSLPRRGEGLGRGVTSLARLYRNFHAVRRKEVRHSRRLTLQLAALIDASFARRWSLTSSLDWPWSQSCEPELARSPSPAPAPARAAGCRCPL